MDVPKSASSCRCSTRRSTSSRPWRASCARHSATSSSSSSMTAPRTGRRRSIRSFDDPRIRLVNQENRGLTKSLNRALSLVRGPYIARMDGNDISERERLERQVDFLDRNEKVGVVGSFSHRIDERGRRVNLYTYPTDGEGIREALWSTCPMCHSSVMFRRACVERVGSYREKVGPRKISISFSAFPKNSSRPTSPSPSILSVSPRRGSRSGGGSTRCATKYW